MAEKQEPSTEQGGLIDLVVMPIDPATCLKLEFKPNILSIHPDGIEVIRIDPEGKIYWHGREVETDDDFRSSMLELAKSLGGMYGQA